jgi:hypothetical protein
MHRLQQFVVGTILPELERAVGGRDSRDDNDVSMTALLVIEGFLWLHLGVELGAFPREASEDVYSYYYSSFFDWLKSYSETRQTGSTPPPFLESSSYLGLPTFARNLVSIGIRGGQPLYDQPSGVGERPDLVDPFQSLMILYSRLCRNSAVRRFLYGIGFQDSDDWTIQWNEQCTAMDLFEAVDSSDASPTATAMVLAGYVSLCEFARNMEEVLNNIEGLAILDSAQLFQFKDRIRNIHAWRLNLSSGVTVKRFEQVQGKIKKMVEQVLRDEKFDDEIKSVQGLLDNSLDLFLESQRVTA